MPASIWLDLEGRREGVYSTARTLCLNNRHSWGEAWFGLVEMKAMIWLWCQGRNYEYQSECPAPSQHGRDGMLRIQVLHFRNLKTGFARLLLNKNIIHIFASQVLTRHVHFLRKLHCCVLSVINNFNISYACLFKIKNASVHTFAMKVVYWSLLVNIITVQS